MFLIESYLQEEVKFFLRSEQELTEYREDLPVIWQEVLIPSLPMEEMITHLWHEGREYLQDVIAILQAHTLEIALIVSQSSSVPLGLYYIYKIATRDRTFWHGWLAGPPANQQDFAAFEQRFGKELPSSYKTFSQIHNGFLSDGLTGYGMNPVDEWLPLSRTFDLSDGERQAMDYDPDLLVEFCPDGLGNGQYYDYRKPILDDDYMTVDWDHETRQISKPEPFFSFIPKSVAKVMRVAG